MKQLLVFIREGFADESQVIIFPTNQVLISVLDRVIQSNLMLLHLMPQAISLMENAITFLN